MRIRCPICRRQDEVAADFPYRPFCSRRCKMIDLGNWLDEVYRIPKAAAGEDVVADDDRAGE